MNKSGYPSYYELLSHYIEKSGLTTGEIAKKMVEEKGVRIDRSYISMLKNNRTKNPASEEINRALAEVIGANPDALILAAYIEKAPLEVKTHLSALGSIDFLLHRLLIAYGDYLSNLNDPANSESLRLVATCLQKYEELTLAEKSGLLNVLVEDMKTKEVEPGRLFDDSFPKRDKVKDRLELKKSLKATYLPVLSVETNKFYPSFQEQLRILAKEHKVPTRYVSTPNNVIYLLTEMDDQYSEFQDILLNKLIDGYTNYLSQGLTYPGSNPNVSIDLDKWLLSGNIKYNGHELTNHDKQRMIDMLNLLFPEYQTPATDQD